MEQISETRTIIHEVSNRVYELIYSLRPSALDDLGLPTAIRAHARRQLTKTGITFELYDDELTDRLPRELETALYRTFQEALNNVIRHAHANKVQLTLSRKNGLFIGEFTDDGCGFDMEKVQLDGNNHRGLGLLGMQERVSQCGGQLEVDSQSGKGTRISIRVNLTETCCD
jgi:signal transduction histidine kinase